MLAVAAALARHSQLEPRPRVVVALSGGVDSTALLYACHLERARFRRLRALHVNHRLMPAADAWQQHAAAAARRLRVPYRALQVDARLPAGASLEEWAREQRYALLAAALQPGEVLLTAQHVDDQAETLLLQLLRGAGVAGLAAMPRVAQFGAGWLARPWLDRSRAEIEAFARSHGLQWVEDASNADERLARAYLRRHVLPTLRSRWPTFATALARSAAHAAEACDLLEQIADRDRATASDGDDLSVTALRRLPLARRKNLLRHWIVRRGLRAPDASRLAEIAGPVLAAREDAQPHVEWEGGHVSRSYGRLLLSSGARGIAADEGTVRWKWARLRTLRFGDVHLELRNDCDGPIDLALVPASLEVRRRRGGERLRPRAGGPSRSVKSLLQLARVPVDVRISLPLVFGDGKLLMVGERWCDTSIAATASSRRRGRLILHTPSS